MSICKTKDINIEHDFDKELSPTMMSICREILISIIGMVDLNQDLDVLNKKQTAFFNVNAVARKEDKNTPATNPYLIKFLKKVAWKPTLLEVFAGKMSYPKYHFFDKHMIRFIMWMSKGPTDPSKVFEFTDWKKVESFGIKVLNDFLKT